MLSADTLIGYRYRVKSKIGQGGMQEVWQAEDKSLERMVALKAPIVAGARKRFAESARLSARVRHPNVAAALDYLTEGAEEYYVEELIDGINLDECMTDHFPRLDPDTCAKVLHHLSKGVTALHRAGVVHRDLKPSNVMVSGDLSFKTVKITDFGIAKLAQTTIDEETTKLNTTNHTEGLSSTLLGALPFLAPEVLRKGKPGAPSIGPAADVWSVGAMGYWLLSGRYPFGTGFDAVANALTGQVQPWDPIIMAAKMTADLAGSLQKIIHSCLALDPNDRPKADVLAGELEKLGYYTREREIGEITAAGQYGGVWFGVSDSGSPFMTHNNELLSGGALKIGARVSYISFPGTPSRRAVAVFRLVDTAS